MLKIIRCLQIKQEILQKLSDTFKMHPRLLFHSEETKQRISDTMTGHETSEETKDKLKAA
jgi:hypothetical protein